MKGLERVAMILPMLQHCLQSGLGTDDVIPTHTESAAGGIRRCSQHLGLQGSGEADNPKRSSKDLRKCLPRSGETFIDYFRAF